MSRLLLLLLATVFSYVLPAPSFAQEDARDRMTRISYDQAPDYIREQVKNIVMNCTEGTLTINKANVYEYTSPETPGLAHYVLDFTPWRGQPVTNTCVYAGRLCVNDSCMVIAYSAVDDHNWVQSQRLYVKAVAIKEVQDNGIALPIVEITRERQYCRNANGGQGECASSYTWYGGKFRYFGYGRKEEVKDPTAEKYAPRTEGAAAP